MNRTPTEGMKTGGVLRKEVLAAVLSFLESLHPDGIGELVERLLRLDPSAEELLARGDEIIESIKVLERRATQVHGVLERMRWMPGIPSARAPRGL